jgi:hypothetical protein
MQLMTRNSHSQAIPIAWVELTLENVQEMAWRDVQQTYLGQSGARGKIVLSRGGASRAAVVVP